MISAHSSPSTLREPSDAQTPAARVSGDFLAVLRHRGPIHSRASRHSPAVRSSRLLLQRFTAAQPLATAKSSRATFSEPLAKQCQATLAPTFAIGILGER